MQNLHQQWFGGPGYYYSLPIPAFGDKGSSWQYWTLENTVQGGRLLLYPIVLYMSVMCILLIPSTTFNTRMQKGEGSMVLMMGDYMSD